MYNRLLSYILGILLLCGAGCHRRCYEQKTYENGIHRHDDRGVVHVPVHKDKRPDKPRKHLYRSNRAAKEDSMRRRAKRRELEMMEAF